MSINGTKFTVANTGNIKSGGTLDISNNFSINNDNFMVDSSGNAISKGNIDISNNISIGNNKFNVDASGNIKSTGSLDISQNLKIGSSLLTVDHQNKRVGVNTTTPEYSLDVSGQIITKKMLLGSSYTIDTSSNTPTTSTTTTTIDISSVTITKDNTPVTPTQINSNEYYYIFDSTTSNYNFTSTKDVKCDILMIGGGGGGGSARAGGGGAGACIVYPNYTMNGQYNIKVGNGGQGSVLVTSESVNGIDTEITNLDGSTIYFRAKGGGGGASIALSGIPNDGGCGGGSASQVLTNGGIAVNTNIIDRTLTGPNITSTYAVYGNMGGRNTTEYVDTLNTMDGAGGGGIGQGGTSTGSLGPVDSQYTANSPGKGGDGLYQSIINGITYNFKNYFGANGVLESDGFYYIGGGGGGGDTAAGVGGNGGKGGGGRGGDGSSTTAGNAVVGIQNTGGGGGGGAGEGTTGNKNGGNGGSGITIIRFKLTNTTTSNSQVNIIEPVVISETIERIYPPIRNATSNTTTITGQAYGNGVYIVSASSNHPGEEPFKIINTDNTGWTQSWTSYNGTPAGTYTGTFSLGGYSGECVKIQLPYRIKLTRYIIEANSIGGVNRAPSIYKIFGSNDDSNWTEIHHKSVALISSNYVSNKFEETISNTNYYKYYALVVNKNIGLDPWLSIGEWQIYGSEKITPEIIDTDYKYLAFKNDGTNQTQYTVNFLESEGTVCDILIVGGGGSGGGIIGGGGGGGGVLHIQNATVPADTYNILVGKGGGNLIGNTAPTVLNNNGKSSLAFGIEVYGGGYGGSGMWRDTVNYIADSGADGGSGGAGGSFNSGRAVSIGGKKKLPSYTNNILQSANIIYNYYGGDGGDGKTIGFSGGGSGGGGASDIKPTKELTSFDGADGKQINIDGNNYYWGGGGGGSIQDDKKAGNGGKGGGGGGSGSAVYTNDTAGSGGTNGISLGQNGDIEGDGIPTAGNGGAHTGGGGGGGGFANPSGSTVSGAGGSGIVIIRYKFTKTINTGYATITYNNDATFGYRNTDTTFIPSIVQLNTGQTLINSLSQYINFNFGNVNKCKMDASGNLTLNGDIFLYSDGRIKENVTTITSALDKVNELSGVNYNIINKPRKQIGVIAQEVEKVLPEVIKNEGELKTVAYPNMVGLLIEALKELDEKVDQMN
jgi:hypothetical protein